VAAPRGIWIQKPSQMITFPLWQEEHHPNTNVFNNQNPKDALKFILKEFGN
jgi:hypothetical protein